MSQPSQHSHVSASQHQEQANPNLNLPQLQTQPSTIYFAQKIGALPFNINDVGVRAIGLPETSALLKQQMQYWIEHDGSEATASADGAKAAERATRYIQHLLDQGGEAAPRCPLQLQLQMAHLRLRELPQQQQNQQQQNQHDQYEPLTSEEQSQFATLVPLSYAEALTYMPTLGRFRKEDVEDVIGLLR